LLQIVRSRCASLSITNVFLVRAVLDYRSNGSCSLLCRKCLSSRNNVQYMLNGIATLDERCQCSTSGLSGGLDVPIRGCVSGVDFQFHEAQRNEMYYCFINDGNSTRCPNVQESTTYPGRMFRLCGDGKRWKYDMLWVFCYLSFLASCFIPSLLTSLAD
jgi:hypothetical protein